LGQGVADCRGNDGYDHERQNDRRGQEPVAAPDRSGENGKKPKVERRPGPMTRATSGSRPRTPKPVHDARNSRQKLDDKRQDDLKVTPEPFGKENGHPQAHGYGNEKGDGRCE